MKSQEGDGTGLVEAMACLFIGGMQIRVQVNPTFAAPTRHISALAVVRTKSVKYLGARTVGSLTDNSRHIILVAIQVVAVRHFDSSMWKLSKQTMSSLDHGFKVFQDKQR